MAQTVFNFKGQTALVTGGTKGIGRAIAGQLAKGGAKVIITGQSAVFKAPVGYVYWPLDLSDSHSVEVFLQKVARLQRLDILVNNAGTNIVEPIDEITLEHWTKVLNVNLTGAMLVAQQAAVLMKKRKSGRILNISSIFGLISRARRNAYSASKAGLIGLTRASALDLAGHGIMVNALCPGFVLTDLTKRILSAAEQAQLKAQIPVGRFGREEEIAQAAAFLCSSSNTYITGQAIVIDGGVSIQ